MNEFPETSASLIAGIKDPGNAAAWDTFEKLYRPVIFRVARAKGMQYADAADLVQQVLFALSKAIDSYQYTPDGPPFRNWLSRITRNAILKTLTRKPKDQAGGGTGAIEALARIPTDENDNSVLIDRELRREIFAQASEKVRLSVKPLTWLVFEMSVLQQKTVESVAEALGISAGNVYAARSRVMKRLREAVCQLEFDCDQKPEL